MEICRLFLAYVLGSSYHTYMAKLTLNVDAGVVTRAKRYAARRGTSVSRLVEKLLSLIVKTAARDDEDVPPGLARLRAELKDSKAEPTAYRRYLERKYR
jgi:uncharacterized protein DUF6364